MTAITNAQTSTITYFEQAMRSQLKTLESEMREDLKDREAEVKELKSKKTMNDRIVEELRPLCEDPPHCTLDPVTMEIFEEPLLYRCGHALDLPTVMNIAKINSLCQQDLIECPTCRKKSPIRSAISPMNLIGCVEIFEKISKVFAKNT